MKIYTGTGDGGKTSLFSGERLAKNSLRVATYGEVDELCSTIGLIVALIPECDQREHLSLILQKIQADLFDIGAILATSPDSPEAGMLRKVSDDKIRWLENNIDDIQEELEELHSFILPGGHIAAAWSQVVRAVCRRVERGIITLAQSEGCLHETSTITYMNRLSDYFFVLARYLNHLSGTAETIWHG
jgi:cob(I)alamin adenosyltransferase